MSYKSHLIWEGNGMGRKKLWDEAALARFESGTLARIDAVLKRRPKEYRTDFIALAVKRELARREAAVRAGKKSGG
jgi:hypothetical protein